MSTPLHSAYISKALPRGIVIDLSPMYSDPAEADVTPDLALQLIVEAHLHSNVRPSHAGLQIFDNLVGWIVAPNFRAFCNAAQYYVYYVAIVNSAPAEDGSGRTSLSLAIGSRLPWLVDSLRPGMLWESAAYSFALSA